MACNMSSGIRRFLSTCLGMLLLIMLLLLASLNSSVEVEPLPKIMTREVQMYSPPPDPPPPMDKKGSPGSPMPSLVMTNVENTVNLEVMSLEVKDLDAGIMFGGKSGIGIGGLGDGYGMGAGGGGSGIVGFSELDRIPIVRSHPLIRYPKEAEDQDVLEFQVMLHIIIDEKGMVYPVRIVKNPFPSMNEDLMKFASAVRFTPPVKLGVPVKTEYLWPLLIKRPLTD